MKIFVDRTKCQGHALCAAAAPGRGGPQCERCQALVRMVTGSAAGTVLHGTRPRGHRRKLMRRGSLPAAAGVLLACSALAQQTVRVPEDQPTLAAAVTDRLRGILSK